MPDQAGQYPLHNDEIELLRKVGITGAAEVDGFWRDNIKAAPRVVGLDE